MIFWSLVPMVVAHAPAPSKHILGLRVPILPYNYER